MNKIAGWVVNPTHRFVEFKGEKFWLYTLTIQVPDLNDDYQPVIRTLGVSGNEEHAEFLLSPEGTMGWAKNIQHYFETYPRFSSVIGLQRALNRDLALWHVVSKSYVIGETGIMVSTLDDLKYLGAPETAANIKSPNLVLWGDVVHAYNILDREVPVPGWCGLTLKSSEQNLKTLGYRRVL